MRILLFVAGYFSQLPSKGAEKSVDIPAPRTGTIALGCDSTRTIQIHPFDYDDDDDDGDYYYYYHH